EAVAGGERTDIGFEAAQKLLDDRRAQPVLALERLAARNRQAASLDGVAPCGIVRRVLDEPARRAPDRGDAEADQGAGRVRRVALEIAPQAAVQPGPVQCVARHGEMVDADLLV